MHRVEGNTSNPEGCFTFIGTRAPLTRTFLTFFFFVFFSRGSFECDCSSPSWTGNCPFFPCSSLDRLRCSSTLLCLDEYDLDCDITAYITLSVRSWGVTFTWPVVCWDLCVCVCVCVCLDRFLGNLHRLVMSPCRSSLCCKSYHYAVV